MAHGDDYLLLSFPSSGQSGYMLYEIRCSHFFVVISRRSPPGLGSDHVLFAPDFGIDLFCLPTEDHYSFLLTDYTILLIPFTIL